jgi:hypothetical protein
MKAVSRKWQVAGALALVGVLAARGAQAGAVNASSDKVGLKLYGQVDRAFLYANDGDKGKLYFVDNKNSSTRFGMDAKAGIEGLTFGGKVEVEVLSNISDGVSQILETSGAAAFKDRHLDAYASGAFGKISLGHGDTASNTTSEQDVSGTEVVAYSSVADLAGGMIFFDKTKTSIIATPAVTAVAATATTPAVAAKDAVYNPKVADIFNNLDGLSRDDRMRYDSPVLAGLQLSGSYSVKKSWDAALRYAAEFAGMKIRAAAAYADMGEGTKAANGDTVKQINGSVSVMTPFGLSLTAAGGQQKLDDAKRKENPMYWYAKLGYTAKLFFAGSTTIALDYAADNDQKHDKDKGTSLGVSFVQRLDNLGTEIFLGYRSYKLDRAATDFAAINGVMGGARIKF